MEFFKKKTNINFIKVSKYSLSVSVLLISLSLFFLLFHGLNMGLDFTGGYQIQIDYQHPPSIKEVNKNLAKSNFSSTQVMNFGSINSLMIKLPIHKNENNKFLTYQNVQSEQHLLKKNIKKILGNDFEISSLNYIGPQVGKELANNGVLALIVAILSIIAYITFRFEIKFAISASIALIHDAIIILGTFAWLQCEFTLTTLAALLAVIGYSLNDTVVIYDRVRDNFRKMQRVTVVEIFNYSVNDTLSRTIMTSGLTLVVVVTLYIFGGPSLHDFSLILILGVIIGTYSSIYIASTLAVLLDLKHESLLSVIKL